MFNKIVVDYYGAPTPVKQLASFHGARGRGWPSSRRTTRARSARSRRRSATPTSASTRPTTATIIRVVFPQLTEERRKEYIKVAKHKAEDARGLHPQHPPPRQGRAGPHRQGRRGRRGRGRARREGARGRHARSTSRRSTSCSSTRKPSCSRSEGSAPDGRMTSRTRRRRSRDAELRRAGARAGAAAEPRPRRPQPARRDRRRRSRSARSSCVPLLPAASRRSSSSSARPCVRRRSGSSSARCAPPASTRRCRRCWSARWRCVGAGLRAAAAEALLVALRAHRARGPACGGCPRTPAGYLRDVTARRVRRDVRAVPRRLRGAAARGRRRRGPGGRLHRH